MLLLYDAGHNTDETAQKIEIERNIAKKIVEYSIEME